VARNRSRRKRSAVSSGEEALQARLEAALSERELRRVLAAALVDLDDGARARLVARVGADTGAALGLALKAPPRGGRRARAAIPPAGKGKALQEWERLWGEWDAVVLDTGHEGGAYILREADWEPPYLDASALAADLDAVAVRMLPLVGRVVRDRIAPDSSLADALGTLDDDLGAGLPDGIDPDECEPCALGPAATSCLLEWEWAVAKRDARGAPAFLDDIRDLESRLRYVGLDQAAVRKFVLGLPDAELRALLESMTRQRSTTRWAEAFTQARGGWAEILRALSRRWSPALHAEVSRAAIAEEWTLALPLVEDAVKRGGLSDARGLIDEAVRSLLRLDESGGWDPRRELLVRRVQLSGGESEDAKIGALLRLWRRTAAGQGQIDLATALSLQITALREAEKGDVMLEAFREVPPAHHEVHDALFADWRGLIVERTLRTWRSSPRVPCGGWVPALVDAARAGPDGVAVFHAAVRGVLEEARSALAVEPRPARRHGWPAFDRDPGPLRALAILALDLDSAAPMLKERAAKLLTLLPGRPTVNGVVSRPPDGRGAGVSMPSRCYPTFSPSGATTPSASCPIRDTPRPITPRPPNGWTPWPRSTRRRRGTCSPDGRPPTGRSATSGGTWPGRDSRSAAGDEAVGWRVLGFIVVECHHVPAASFERVLAEAKPRYVVGLTAMLRRRDGHDPSACPRSRPSSTLRPAGRRGAGRREARRLVREALLAGRPLEPLDFRHDELVADTLAEDMPPRWLAETHPQA
jgi:hypothetical protein